MPSVRSRKQPANHPNSISRMQPHVAAFGNWYRRAMDNEALHRIYVYSLFAGKSAEPILQEAKGEEEKCCRMIYQRMCPPIAFVFNETDERRQNAVQKFLGESLDPCLHNCMFKTCQIRRNSYFSHHAAENLLDDKKLGEHLTNRQYAKYILMGEETLKHLSPKVLRKFVRAANTDIALHLNTYYDGCYTADDALIRYLEAAGMDHRNKRPYENHQLLAEHLRSQLPKGKEYYLLAFTHREGNHYECHLIGTPDAPTAEAFLREAWKLDPLNGETDARQAEAFPQGSLFFEPPTEGKAKRVAAKLNFLVERRFLKTPEAIRKYQLRNGCLPRRKQIKTKEKPLQTSP